MKKQKVRNQINGMLFCLPWIIGFCAFTLYPMIQAFYFSLCRYGGLVMEPQYIGFKNYIDLFTNDSLFGTVIYNTLYLMLIGGILVILFSLSISILLNDKRLKGTAGFRVFFFLPTLIPAVILCLMWIWLFNVDNGLINQALGLLGIEGPGWLSSLVWSKPALIIMRIWASGNLIIIFLGGLQDIPTDLYEAVDIDGGNFWHKTFHVTIPMLKPVILFNVISTIIQLMQIFTEPLIMSDKGNGGPMDTTYTFGLYIYKNAFQYNTKMGYACALAWILLIVSMIFAFIALRAGGYFEDIEKGPKVKKQRKRA